MAPKKAAAKPKLLAKAKARGVRLSSGQVDPVWLPQQVLKQLRLHFRDITRKEIYHTKYNP
eukprot:6907124-Lingulodinium_polyedra.AAC.1